MLLMCHQLQLADELESERFAAAKFVGVEAAGRPSSPTHLNAEISVLKMDDKILN